MAIEKTDGETSIEDVERELLEAQRAAFKDDPFIKRVEKLMSDLPEEEIEPSLLDLTYDISDIAQVSSDHAERAERVRAHKDEHQTVHAPGYVVEDDPLKSARLIQQIRESARAFPETHEVDDGEYTGRSVSYYQVEVASPTTPGRQPYVAECNDVIEALGMNFAEGNAFKALWRMAAARSGKFKKGYEDEVYDAEKLVFFGERIIEMAKLRREKK